MNAPCHLDASHQATSSCQQCLRPTCDVCLSATSSGLVCVWCVQQSRRAARRSKLLMTVGALAVVGGVTAFALLHEPGFDYGKESREVARLLELMAREPCDRSNIIKLSEATERAGDHRGTIQRAEAFLAACGKHPRLLWVTHEARKNAGDLPGSINDATTLMAEYPDDQDYPWWRGQVQELNNNLDAAVDDYTLAFNLCPDCVTVAFYLSAALEKAKRPCDAVFPLERALRSRQGRVPREELEKRIQRLLAAPECAARAGSGRAVVAFDPQGGAFHTQAIINGVSIPVVVDTGSTFVALSTAQALRVGVSLQGARPARVKTAAGIRDGKLVMADSVTVQGAVAHHVQVLVLGSMGATDEGLLGLSFLSRFTVKTQQREGRLIIGADAPKPAPDRAAEQARRRQQMGE
ncbi:MAG: clan AA aspartic protease [Deltaproteobacteria bacterium]|nr:clan AA aspartic protease [Deltaproteobacteria bacterium]